MKKTLITVLSLSAVVTMSFVMSDNGKAGKNGSPGENTCAESGCHTGNPVNSSNGSVTITAPTMTNWQYVPGQVYPISVTVAQQGRSLFGLGFEALLASGANGGTITITNSTQMQIKNATVNGNIRANVVHKLNGGASANTHTFTFNWTAPASTAGTITFYAAGNAANNDGNESGDFIYTASRTVSPVTTGIEEAGSTAASMQVYPNPATDQFTVSYGLQQSSDVEINVFSTNGKLVMQQELRSESPGTHETGIRLDSGLPKGIYLVELRHDGQSETKRIMII